MAGRGWWPQNYCWSWVVVGGGGKIIAGRGWPRIVARFSNAHFSELFLSFSYFITTFATLELVIF